jgi:hypothetical protein
VEKAQAKIERQATVAPMAKKNAMNLLRKKQNVSRFIRFKRSDQTLSLRLSAWNRQSVRELVKIELSFNVEIRLRFQF